MTSWTSKKFVSISMRDFESSFIEDADDRLCDKSIPTSFFKVRLYVKVYVQWKKT